AAEKVVELLELAHGLGERIPAFAAVEQSGELARIALLHSVGGALGSGEVVLQLWRVGPAVEIGQIPFRQASELRLRRLLGGVRAFRPGLANGIRGKDRVHRPEGKFAQHRHVKSSDTADKRLEWERDPRAARGAKLEAVQFRRLAGRGPA